MPFLQIKTFFFCAESGAQSLSMFLFGALSKSESKWKDCREIGRVCLCVVQFSKIGNSNDLVRFQAD